MTYPRKPTYWGDTYRLTATRYPRLYVGRWLGRGTGWRVFGTDDCRDTAPIGPPNFQTRAEALAWIEGPEALDWLTPLPPKEVTQ